MGTHDESPEQRLARLRATQAKIAEQAAKDEAARRSRPRQIGETLRSFGDSPVTATVEQITNTHVLLRLDDGSFRWVDRGEIA